MNLSRLATLWPPFGDPSTDFPEDLLGAVAAAILANGPAAAALPGGVFLEEAGGTVVRPYAVVEEVSATKGWLSESSKFQDTTLRVRAYGEGDAPAGRAGDAIVAALRGRSLTWVGGWCTPLVATNRKHAKDHARSVLGYEVYFLLLEFTTRVKRP